MPNQYAIKKGDTLGGISKSTGFGMQDILKANPNIKDPNKIYGGSSLNLPSSATDPNSPKGKFIQGLAKEPSVQSTPPVAQNSPTTASPQPQATPTIDPNASYRSAFDQYISSLKPSQEESSARSLLSNLTLQAKKDYEEALGRGETLGFASGEAARVNRNNAFGIEAAANAVDAFSNERQAMTEAQKARLDFEKSLRDSEIEQSRYADERAFNKEKFAYQKESDKAANDLAVKKFNEDVRQFGIETAQKNQMQAAQIRKLNTEIQSLGVPPINSSKNPQAGQYSQALGVILGSGKFTKDQAAAVVRGINSGEDPVAVIKNQAKNIMGQTLATDLDKYETARAQLDSIDTLLKDYYASGGKTGVFTGNYEKIINKLGQVDDPRLVEIATNIAAALQIYRNAVSGTAYSVQEGKDIASIFPGINKSEGLNNAILSGRRKAFETSIDAKYRNTLGSAYDALKSPEKTSSQPVGVLAPGSDVDALLGKYGL